RYQSHLLVANPLFSYVLLFQCSPLLQDLHSFPTRRSSDLKFIDAVNGDWGGAPFEDLMLSLDYAEKAYAFIDKDRECALGASYRSEEHTSELQSRENLVCRLLLEKKKNNSLSSVHYELP